MFRRARFGRRKNRKIFSRNFFLASEISSPGTTGHTFPDTVGATDVAFLDATTLIGQDASHGQKKIVVHSITYSSQVSWASVGDGPTSGPDDAEAAFAEAIYADDVNTSDAPEVVGQVFLLRDATNATTDLRLFPDRIVHRRYSTLPATSGVDNIGGAATGIIDTHPHTLRWYDPVWGLTQRVRRKLRLLPDMGLFFRLEVDSGSAAPIVYEWSAAGVISFEMVT